MTIIKNKTTCHADALGVPIVFGQRYGFSSNKNGFTRVTIGEALNFTEKGVTLKVESRIEAMYDNEPKEQDIKENEKTTVRGINLFPV